MMTRVSHAAGGPSHFQLPLSSFLHVLLTAWSAISWGISAILTLAAHFILPHAQKREAPYCGKHVLNVPIPRLSLPASTSGKLTVVLDLDETLVCTYPSDQIPVWLQTSAPQRYPMRRIQYGRSGSPSNTITVYERPGLHAFLAQASRFADLVIFTAGHAAYARPVVDLIDPERTIFAATLFRDATVTSSARDNVKDLALLGRDLSRTVLVDNNPYSFLMQPANGLPIAPYHGDPQDCHLLGVVLPLLEALAQLQDVRHVLGPKFQMAAWFRNKGLSVPDPLPQPAS